MAEKLSAVLEREHREIDGGIEQFVAGSGVEPLRRSMAALRRHIYLEERYLFPPLREAGLMMPIMVMLREHGELWKAMDALEQSVADNSDATANLDQCRDLLALLDKHNTKEEPIIYPHADSDLDDYTATLLGDFVEEGRMPEGWVCEAAR
jgi:hemerythrin-like domain-containing protein